MGKKVTVLVVEDEPLILLDIVDYLENEGFRVLQAANAAQAIEMLEREPAISIIFTDVEMPGTMDGLKLAALVRDRWPPVKIVVTSGHKTVEITDLPDGGVFFSKPYRPEELATTFRKLTSPAS